MSRAYASISRKAAGEERTTRVSSTTPMGSWKEATASIDRVTHSSSDKSRDRGCTRQEMMCRRSYGRQWPMARVGHRWGKAINRPLEGWSFPSLAQWLWMLLYRTVRHRRRWPSPSHCTRPVLLGILAWPVPPFGLGCSTSEVGRSRGEVRSGHKSLGEETVELHRNRSGGGTS